MNQFREYSVRGTKDCPLSRYNIKRTDAGMLVSPSHWHPETEILLVRSGRIAVRAGKRSVVAQPGQLVFIAPQELHSISTATEDVCYDAFVFSLRILSTPEDQYLQSAVIRPILDGKARFPLLLSPETQPLEAVTLALNKVCECEKNTPKFKLAAFSALATVFTQLAERLEPNTDHTVRSGNQVIKICLAYMQENCANHLCLDDIAAQVHMHPNYLCTLFKEYTGQTVFSHLIRIRIEESCRLLRDTDLPVSDCAIRSGFDNPGYFSRKFKEFTGMTPKSFRRSSKKFF